MFSNQNDNVACDQETESCSIWKEKGVERFFIQKPLFWKTLTFASDSGKPSQPGKRRSKKQTKGGGEIQWGNPEPSSKEQEREPNDEIRDGSLRKIGEKKIIKKSQHVGGKKRAALFIVPGPFEAVIHSGPSSFSLRDKSGRSLA